MHVQLWPVLRLYILLRPLLVSCEVFLHIRTLSQVSAPEQVLIRLKIEGNRKPISHIVKMRQHPLHVFILTISIISHIAVGYSSQAGLSSTTPSNDLTLFSPCKINLFLRILRKRPDGYHDLASLFQTVAFGDTLHLSRDPNAVEDSMECNMVGVPVDKTNLVLRAIELVKVKTGRTDTFFRANLVKQVPAQAGLGGGSGNAAAAMWGTNVLLGSPASLEQVIRILAFCL